MNPLLFALTNTLCLSIVNAAPIEAEESSATSHHQGIDFIFDMTPISRNSLTILALDEPLKGQIGAEDIISDLSKLRLNRQLQAEQFAPVMGHLIATHDPAEHTEYEYFLYEPNQLREMPAGKTPTIYRIARNEIKEGLEIGQNHARALKTPEEVREIATALKNFETEDVRAEPRQREALSAIRELIITACNATLDRTVCTTNRFPYVEESQESHYE